jgi:hypothetical protein
MEVDIEIYDRWLWAVCNWGQQLLYLMYWKCSDTTGSTEEDVGDADCHQLPATTNVCKARGCSYTFWAPDDERCVTRNMLSN